MTEVQAGDLLWQPLAEVVENANLTRFMRWLATERNLNFADYDALWRWSVTELGAFWQAIWDFCGVQASQRGEVAFILGAPLRGPGAVWFPEARLNYAENIFAQMTDAHPALLYEAEEGPLVEVSWAEFYGQTAVLQHTFKKTWHRAGGSRRRLPAQHSRSDHCLHGHGEFGCHLVQCLARFWQQSRA